MSKKIIKEQQELLAEGLKEVMDVAELAREFKKGDVYRFTVDFHLVKDGIRLRSPNITLVGKTDDTSRV